MIKKEEARRQIEAALRSAQVPAGYTLEVVDGEPCSNCGSARLVIMAKSTEHQIEIASLHVPALEPKLERLLRHLQQDDFIEFCIKVATSPTSEDPEDDTPGRLLGGVVIEIRGDIPDGTNLGEVISGIMGELFGEDPLDFTFKTPGDDENAMYN
jgi:hypothetical protein